MERYVQHFLSLNPGDLKNHLPIERAASRRLRSVTQARFPKEPAMPAVGVARNHNGEDLGDPGRRHRIHHGTAQNRQLPPSRDRQHQIRSGPHQDHGSGRERQGSWNMLTCEADFETGWRSDLDDFANRRRYHPYFQESPLPRFVPRPPTHFHYAEQMQFADDFSYRHEPGIHPYFGGPPLTHGWDLRYSVPRESNRTAGPSFSRPSYLGAHQDYDRAVEGAFRRADRDRRYWVDRRY
ncbi:hypothetical protein FPV67DRAFT_4099 [Lyophyllum atratum]|nr:hypothetical protein FPV67DRAFT_4099 [Lyophyllum atratum]